QAEDGIRDRTVAGVQTCPLPILAGAFPDLVVGCFGGGSNFAGLAFPFLREKFAGREVDLLACERAACPTLTRGHFAYDFGDTGKIGRASCREGGQGSRLAGAPRQ